MAFRLLASLTPPVSRPSRVPHAISDVSDVNGRTRTPDGPQRSPNPHGNLQIESPFHDRGQGGPPRPTDLCLQVETDARPWLAPAAPINPNTDEEKCSLSGRRLSLTLLVWGREGREGLEAYGRWLQPTRSAGAPGRTEGLRARRDDPHGKSVIFVPPALRCHCRVGREGVRSLAAPASPLRSALPLRRWDARLGGRTTTLVAQTLTPPTASPWRLFAAEASTLSCLTVGAATRRLRRCAAARAGRLLVVLGW